jgi:EAL domain-containing protein (putative c-di-GMP-specific phosphodiesterase class I)
METTVEGIETEPQAVFMRALGCVLAQGHFYGKPTSATGAEQLLKLQAARDWGIP